MKRPLLVTASVASFLAVPGTAVAFHGKPLCHSHMHVTSAPVVRTGGGFITPTQSSFSVQSFAVQSAPVATHSFGFQSAPVATQSFGFQSAPMVFGPAVSHAPVVQMPAAPTLQLQTGGTMFTPQSLSSYAVQGVANSPSAAGGTASHLVLSNGMQSFTVPLSAPATTSNGSVPGGGTMTMVGADASAAFGAVALPIILGKLADRLLNNSSRDCGGSGTTASGGTNVDAKLDYLNKALQILLDEKPALKEKLPKSSPFSKAMTDLEQSGSEFRTAMASIEAQRKMWSAPTTALPAPAGRTGGDLLARIAAARQSWAGGPTVTVPPAPSAVAAR